MQPRMPFDDVAWEKSEEISDNWVDELFANENTLEVAAIRYLQDHTSIPVPFILHWGTKEESPLGLGPFIIMEYIEHEMNMSKALNTPGISH
ncbi:hypothetical protein P175DRAFT_0500208 [Aspergillus ochraceoroseus IBT 24754]|uniref:Aminoglycoside phosphotransferase domain-containing protein n=1 Tax=Aspergillus ochraceoroseus IBT 24754 TaxID=1392256 RepID=A0A2T5LYE1_9EURO|nr:uncharacterized protein P175DRAFT_0500208 [Aspergillus ochraceoroseus IBT 24754]PTU21307.1 hypothetical protein P175DRAFT_0500208 [Aspergillus ochraceoroseus IBT 24754]